MDQSRLIELFVSSGFVSPTGARDIAQHFTYATYKRNDWFLKEGLLSDKYLFLESGFMRAFAFDIEGRDITTNFYGAGQLVFEITSFFSRTKSKENIQALCDCTGWEVTFDELNFLFHQLPEFREFGRSVLVRHSSMLKSRMLSMITETAEERYRNLLAAKSDIFQYAALKDIATYLGITDTSLSRIRRELSKA